jgi:hypothetical protein
MQVRTYYLTNRQNYAFQSFELYNVVQHQSENILLHYQKVLKIIWHIYCTY